MTASPFAGKPLDYLIAVDGALGIAGHIIEPGYGVERAPAAAPWIMYGNMRDQEGGRKYPPYLADGDNDDIGRRYGEPAPDPAGAGFWRLINLQLDRAQGLGAPAIEWDNLDTYNVVTALKVFDLTWQRALYVAVKNPNLVSGKSSDLIRHPAAAIVIVESGAGEPAEVDALRHGAGKADIPLRFVFYGDDRNDAEDCARVAADLSDVGVTFDPSGGEYRAAEHLLIPRASQSSSRPTMPSTQVDGAAIIAAARSFIGKFHDGPNVPMMALAIGRAWPDMASYAAGATSGTAWCGIFVAYVLTEKGIRPPFVANDNAYDDFMWADAPIEAKWGTIVSRAEAQPGDIVVLRSPHHITFFDGDAGDSFWGVGGNQSDAVTRAQFAWSGVRAVVRPPGQRNPISPVVPSRQFEICVALLLNHEGGNDDDPDDPGGRTSRGILQREWDRWRTLHAGLPSDVWQAPQDQVLAIYREWYWNALNCDRLAAGLDYAVFDYGVNSGISRAARVLQGFVGAVVDGEIGPETIGKAARAGPAKLVAQICDERLTFLRGLSTWWKFGGGWTARVNDVRAAALAMIQKTPEPTMPDPTPPNPPTTPLPALDLAGTIREIQEAVREGLQAWNKVKEQYAIVQGFFGEDFARKLLTPLLAGLPVGGSNPPAKSGLPGLIGMLGGGSWLSVIGGIAALGLQLWLNGKGITGSPFAGDNWGEGGQLLTGGGLLAIIAGALRQLFNRTP